jgi:hypothetical protein
MSKTGLYLCILVLLTIALEGCAPAAKQQAALPVERADDATFQGLLSPFGGVLDELGVSVASFETFRYEGTDKAAFVQAINAFYKQNPGFCPLEDAFFAAESGLQFLTLASNNGNEVRGFLYDQSRKPKLTYAYFTGSSAQRLTAIVCETAKAEN